MLSRVWSSTTIGVDALPIEVETHIDSGLPKYTVVGLPHGAVRESRDRILSALKNSSLPVPRGRITINLAPADVPKEGAAFDLPLAVGLLAAYTDRIDTMRLHSTWVMGELALDGSVRPVRGVLPMAIKAWAQGCDYVIVPKENAREAAVVDGLSAVPVETVEDAMRFLVEGPDGMTLCHNALSEASANGTPQSIDFADVRGQDNVKRALEVAAAGGHNVLMVGPPGSGKTMLARRMPGILPPLSTSEALETTKIYSVHGTLDASKGLVTQRPFRSPHHTISDAGLCGGGANPTPGEISLAHNGVLFLDELPEFQRRVLEVMRQPIEEGRITISRARTTVTYPARFMLVASMNPCPCGYLNDPKRECVCRPAQIQRYLGKISGPLMDRIDLHIEVAPVDFDELQSDSRGAERSKDIRGRVMSARDTQSGRFSGREGLHANAQMGARAVQEHCGLDSEGTALLKMAIDRLGLSARAYTRVLKVARTIADLDQAASIRSAHISEAIQYRTLDRDWWNG
ncbi:magnesium chelatase [Longimonas halophila]|uniref:Magnesium chelatase n=1 Tax=Longimonas halophila TaxID=1469170 RepID=A0A2H3NLN9_9BACT|nr:YifB family Mg chelatase-like AAA ATPase [Longimonas halophila]PEN07054.1 magnesium chelatase [Longimonas halophila]